MTSDFDYKKYSLEKLQEWVHDALSCGEASPHEIYSAIREAAREDYQYYKDHSARAFGLLELLSGHRPVADDSMRPWGHSDIEYQIVNRKKSLTCDKDDPSPECKRSWDSFWGEEYKKDWDAFEATYYPEEYQGSTVSSVKQDKVKKWVLPVEELRDEETGEDEYCISFPDDLLEAANLKEGDTVEWIDQGDGSYLLKKVKNQPLEQPSWVRGNELARVKTYQEMIDDGWTMTDDGFWVRE